ncbi:MAG: L-fucose/L-arabinose isomerase family protein [Anaerolinea sp.]|nr:L-fucose/L-arabinose isomerase family protein [Anaerolinea sp.]
MIHLGFVAILRTTFDVELARAVVDRARSALADADYTLFGPAEPVSTVEEAQAAAELLVGQEPDLLVIFQSTFADTSMVMAIAQRVDAPLLLWAVPEAHTGSRLRLNSLCGINLAGHALTRAGIPYSYIYADPDDPDALDAVAVQARAAAARRILRRSRVGRVGENPAGFETCLMDAPLLRQRFGVEVMQLDLREQVFVSARAASPERVGSVGDRLAERVTGLDTLDHTAVHGTLSVYTALHDLAVKNGLSGYAVRCWPEFFTDLGCAACGAMSMLNDEHIPSSCEADVNGTITSLMLQAISGGTTFSSDIVSLDRERDALVLWHCGLAPLDMADDDLERPGVTIHSNRRLPLLMQFTLKPGAVTLARLSEATGSYRLVIGRGEIIRAPRAFSGTSGHLRLEGGSAAALDTILREGLEHHISISYGDHVRELRALARMLDLPVLQL